MTIPNNREGEDTKIRQEYYKDANGNTHTQRTSETVKNSDRSYQEAYLAERDQNNTSRGLVFGIVLTSLITLIGSAFWYFNQRNNPTVEKTTPVLVPVPSSSATPTSPQPQTTIIERTREIPVPVPQQSVSPPSVSSPPDINITIPPQPSTTQPSPKSTQSPNSDSSTSNKKNSSINTTPPSTQSNTSDTTVDSSQPPSNNGTSNTGNATGTEGR